MRGGRPIPYGQLLAEPAYLTFWWLKPWTAGPADQQDIVDLYEQLTCADVKLITLSESKLNVFPVGFEGTIKALFFRDSTAKVW